MDIDRALQYLSFVVDRHRIWEQRQAGAPGPWTKDPVLAHRKFTNVFRVLDPGSQFVITDLLPDVRDSPRDFLWRCLLYRMTNRPEMWVDLASVRGYEYPRAEDGDPELIDELVYLRDRLKVQIFSGAYVIQPRPGIAGAGTDKAVEVVKLAREFLDTGWDAFEKAGTQSERFAALRGTPGIGDFIAQQVLTDYGYGFPTDPKELFVVAGPGARAGAGALYGEASRRAPRKQAAQAIRWAAVTGPTMPGWPSITTPSGPRQPSSMDLQNTLCEFSKYVRYEGRQTPTAAYTPAHPGPQPQPVLPAHW